MAKTNHFQCFSQHRSTIAVYRRPSRGRSSLGLNDYVAYNERKQNKPQFFKNGKEVTC